MKVLIAADGSLQSNNAIDFYFSNIHKEDNVVVVFCHIDIPQIPLTAIGGLNVLPRPGMHPTSYTQIDETMKHHEKKCKTTEKSIKGRVESYANVTVLVETHEGEAGHNIVKMAEEKGAELIVTGSRGLGVFRRTVLGSISDYVIHHSKIPVFVYHE